MGILEYISQNALILIPVLYVIGMMLKATPKVQDWLIPWILMICGIAGAVFIIGLNIQGIIQGILVAGACVYGNQLVKQTVKKD